MRKLLILGLLLSSVSYASETKLVTYMAHEDNEVLDSEGLVVGLGIQKQNLRLTMEALVDSNKAKGNKRSENEIVSFGPSLNLIVPMKSLQLEPGLGFDYYEPKEPKKAKGHMNLGLSFKLNQNIAAGTRVKYYPKREQTAVQSGITVTW